MREKRVSVGKGRYVVDLTATITMDGLIVCIVGGEKPHVGAVALGIPRPSLKNSNRLGATISVLTVTGHKDDEVARPAAEILARELNQAVVVVAGLHIENAKDEDLRKLTRNSKQAIERFLKEFKVNSMNQDKQA
jgi:hypothetical protein